MYQNSKAQLDFKVKDSSGYREGFAEFLCGFLSDFFLYVKVMLGHFNVGMAYHALDGLHVYAQGLQLGNVGVAAAVRREGAYTIDRSNSSLKVSAEVTGIEGLTRYTAVPKEGPGLLPEEHGTRLNVRRHGDIPYGLSERTLSKRIDETVEELTDEGKMNRLPAKDLNALIELKTFPMKNWEYNHVVGFIKISVDRQDVDFNVFLPYDKWDGHLPRYLWWATRRHFVQDSSISGLHFYLGNMKSNEEIRQRISETLYGIVKNHIPKRYFADTRAFDAINPHMDYMALIGMA